MKLVQKGIRRVTITQSELVGMIERAVGATLPGEADVLITPANDPETLLGHLQPDHAITIQWTEVQKEEEHGERTRPN